MTLMMIPIINNMNQLLKHSLLSKFKSQNNFKNWQVELKNCSSDGRLFYDTCTRDAKSGNVLLLLLVNFEEN